MTPARAKEIKSIVRDQIIVGLQEDLGGGESIMKEAWEEMETDEEQQAANEELGSIISLLKRL